MQFIAALPTFDTDQAAQLVWQWLQEKLGNFPGVCYYKYPIVGFGTAEIPDLTLLVRGYQPLAIKCADLELADIRRVTDDSWEVRDGDKLRSIDSPFAVADDFKVWLHQRFERERPLRGKLSPVGLVALPLVSRSSFTEKFDVSPSKNTIWRDGDKLQKILKDNESQLSDTEWRIARSVLQAATPINVASGPAPSKADTIGKAVRVLEKRIALLDEEQQKVAIQIPPGPQRIRGLAGTGKTVLLAMRASNIHQHFSEKRILFTFHTQSLYNQATKLITRFYRFHSDQDPDWDKIHVRHSWGGRGRRGVYSDLWTQHLQEAVAAYRAALEERKRERVPLDWARTQNNLGTALASLGKRESGTQHLQEAVAVFEQAVKVFQAARATHDVVRTERNLALARANLQAKQNSAPKR